SHGQSSGEAVLSGLYSADDTNLRIVGQIHLELLEDLLRSSFRHTHGEAQLDVALRGKSDDLKVTGRAVIKGAKLVPNAIEIPIEVSSGVLEMQPNRATLRGLLATVDGAATAAEGSVEVQSYTPLQLGHIDF